MKENSEPNWRTISMEELWSEHNNFNPSSVFIKPKFPTTRYGKVYTKTATTNLQLINLLIEIMKKQGRTVRKRICHETTLKLKKRGKFYKIEEKIK